MDLYTICNNVQNDFDPLTPPPPIVNDCVANNTIHPDCFCTLYNNVYLLDSFHDIPHGTWHKSVTLPVVERLLKTTNNS